MRYHAPIDPKTPSHRPLARLVSGRVCTIASIVATVVVAAFTGANAALVKQTSARDRQVRVYRAGQVRQTDGVEEIIPRHFEPEHDAVSDLVGGTDLILVRDADERGAPHRATPLLAGETFILSLADTTSTLVFLPAPQRPAPQPLSRPRGRAPPLASL